jgi:hypothetical protein
MSQIKINSKAMTLALALGFLSAMFCSRATASVQPIVGSIDFGGSVTLDSMSLANATEVMAWNSSFVLQDSGSFSSIAPGTHSIMASQWIFNQGTPSSPSPGPATPSLWNVGGFTFDLSNSTVLPGQSSNFLHVTGTGTVSGNGFSPTPGLWSFTISNSNGQDQASFGFQANTVAVPEAGTVTLIAIGSICLAAGRLLKRKQA